MQFRTHPWHEAGALRGTLEDDDIDEELEDDDDDDDLEDDDELDEEDDGAWGLA